ncbi:ATP-binding response regulator [Maricaulis maris]|uniref:histidine kinase n=1 Tax=Maricaulis maris TaxID=74318 RepID=A0A495D381_9PROT|nr:ATP-binding protein [Maricaulis maris]RKQ96213.1 signal transduction histidine kinase [Maricaulis maris]
MTDTTRHMPDPASATEPAATDLEQVRMGQARLLRDRTGMSCLIIGGVILYLAILIMLAGQFAVAASWVAAAGSMVGIVFLYPRLAVPDGVDRTNYRRYLTGHVVISGLTGVIWALFAIAILDAGSLLHLFIAINMVFAITVGGMMPSAEYRSTYIALATATLVPFSAYWLITIDGPLRLIGLGLLIYYGFGLLVSARAEIQTKEMLAAERNRELTRRLQEKNALIEKVSAEKSRFLAATSHDMSQPLQAQGFFIGAMRPLMERPDQTALLDKIEACWQAQQQLLQALVETARLDSGAIVAKPRAFDLTSVLTGLEQEFAEPAHDNEIALETRFEPAVLDSDPLLVARILRNLLSNAVKFTPAGGRVSLQSRRDGDRVRIEVCDTGNGIPADAIDRVFDEYVQLAPTRDNAPKGLGLGLPIVRQLARKLGAELTFDSTPGEGTRASITLACQPVGEIAAPASPSPAEITGAPLIVLVEDESSVRDALSILLTDWKCRVIAAASGADAIELMGWATSEPALLIVDKRLADGEDGLETIAALRSEVAADIPAVLLTGDVYQFEKLAGLDNVTVLTKPTDPAQLRQTLLDSLAHPPHAD